jgi:Cu(I)/Ag(I) efflux system membrane fusion protein
MSDDSRERSRGSIRVGAGGIVATVLATAIVTAVGITMLRPPAATAPTAVDAAAEPVKEMWQCPMHPTIVRDHPGNCPICGMKLLNVDAAGDEHAGQASVGATPEGLATVTIDPARQQLIGLKLAHVERARVAGSWRTTGRVAVDETRVHHVNVKFSGFIEHVHGDFVGRPVTKGEALFAIYSPELLAAQEEYVLALRTQSKLDRGDMARDGAALVASARRKLELLDVPESQIRALAKTGEPSRTVTIYSPASGVLTKKDVVPGMRVNAGDMPFEIVDLSHVWVLADAYESDLAHVAVGMRATLTLKAFPNRSFQGQVTFIDPLLDSQTRTAKVRIEFLNEGGELRPEMFGEVVLQGEGHEGLRIPADAVIQSGTQSVVFVALGDGKFQPREIQLGTGDSQHVEVLAGLEEGDAVVTRANFLIDSESRLRASLAALSSGEPSKPGTPEQARDPDPGHRR